MVLLWYLAFLDLESVCILALEATLLCWFYIFLTKDILTPECTF